MDRGGRGIARSHCVTDVAGPDPIHRIHIDPQPPGFMETNHREITEMLHAMREGDERAREQLWNIAYDELRRIAHYRMQRERKGHTLSTTGLVHEAYFKLVGVAIGRIEDRDHFFAFASHVMRQVLIDYARKSKAQKNNGGVKPEPLDNAMHENNDGQGAGLDAEMLIDLDVALKELEELNPIWAQVVTLRTFGGLTFREIGKLIDRDKRTAERYWQHARKWLYNRLNCEPEVPCF